MLQTMTQLNPDEALQRLLAGNRRFVDGKCERDDRCSPERRAELTSGQNPFAVILGCSDSRVPAELVFDQGLGDLFVIRVAGNIVAPSQIGSIEFATEVFGTQLVIVLGHSCCGAIRATVDSLLTDSEQAPAPHLYSIIDRIAPNITPLLQDKHCQYDETQLLQAATHANIRASVHELCTRSATLSEKIRIGQLRIVGAEYELASGRVALLEKS